MEEVLQKWLERAMLAYSSEEEPEERKVIITRAEALKKYKKQIKKLPDGRFYIYLNKKKIMGYKLETVLDRITKVETDERPEVFGAYIKQWLEERENEKTYGTYSQNLYYYETYIKGSKLERTKLCEYTSKDVKKFEEHIRSIKEDLTEKYLKNVFSMLNEVCKSAGVKAIWESTTHRDNFNKTVKTKQEQWFTEEEATAVCELAKREAEKVYPLGIVLVKCTGIRMGELCALTWDCWNGNCLEIKREAIRTKAGLKIVEHTKTPAGERSIPLNAEAKEVLKTIQAMGKHGAYIFGTEKREFPTPRCFDKRLRRYCKTAKMPVIKSMHDLRRSFATRLHLAGCSIETIQKWMGHSTEAQTWGYIMQKRTNEEENTFINAI